MRSANRAGRSGLALLVAASLAGCATSQRARGPGAGSEASELAALERLVQQSCARHAVDPALVRGVIEVESGFRVDARSSVGARGLMQLMPRTAAALALRLRWPSPQLEDPAFNIEAGTAYLARLLQRFDGRVDLALAAYHTGPSRVQRWVARGTLLPGYSRRYIGAVLAARDRLQGPLDQLASARRPVDLDRAGLRALLRQRLYGPRVDEVAPP
ncbi:MAG: lytic transglycosylase domain-containing protein [Proteobacteria bacterium]|nr:lytic transglycosylase domain-containing protein [Pseudomonadota bacterium]